MFICRARQLVFPSPSLLSIFRPFFSVPFCPSLRKLFFLFFCLFLSLFFFCPFLLLAFFFTSSFCGTHFLSFFLSPCPSLSPIFIRFPFFPFLSPKLVPLLHLFFFSLLTLTPFSSLSPHLPSLLLFLLLPSSPLFSSIVSPSHSLIFLYPFFSDHFPYLITPSVPFRLLPRSL